MLLHSSSHGRLCVGGGAAAIRRSGHAPQAPCRPPPGSSLSSRSSSRSSRLQRVAVAAPEAPEAAPAAAAPTEASVSELPLLAPAAEPPSLANLQLQAVIDTKGRVDPPVDPAAAAAVFGVYDATQKLQYIGFSKDLRSSLRTVLGRRPDKVYYYKAVQLPSLDQEVMLAVRQAWFDECGAPPPGNKLALERKSWQSAVDAGAISARAKPAAAAEKAKELQAALKARGCVETFTPDPELLQEGQVEFITVGLEQQQSDAAAAQALAADANAATGASDSSGSSGSPVRTASVVVDGQAKQFTVEYRMKFPTKGGYMIDARLAFDHMETNHRIIVGKAYYEPYEGVAVEAAVEASLALILSMKMPRHNEGMLGTSEFPVNYFTVSEMEQWYGEDFAAQFLQHTGHALTDGMDFFWRMNKIHDYGGKLEDPANLGAALTGSGLGKL